jgi:hypothetical protein
MESEKKMNRSIAPSAKFVGLFVVFDYLSLDIRKANKKSGMLLHTTVW